MFASNTSQVSSDATYVEDVFSNFLYTGAGANQTITNSIDLSGQGGLVWIKDRTQALAHRLYDTARGVGGGSLETNGTAAQNTFTGVTAFNSNGFSLSGANAYVTSSGDAFASWTFRKQPKFFDVVTYTGTGANTTIAHNLGSVPGCIIVKRTDTTSNWAVWHVELGNGEYLQLNATSAKTLDSTVFQSTNPTSTIFRVGTSSLTNASGGTYVAYLFASDAGGFGLTGTDNVISCGSFTPPAGGVADINLGWEPQWLLMKKPGAVSDWFIFDTMRGISYSTTTWLTANTSNAETSIGGDYVLPTATGFKYSTGFTGNDAMIYIAIRRGPMKTPTTGTSVFSPVVYSGNNVGSRQVFSGNFNPDMVFLRERGAVNTLTPSAQDRLRGYGFLYTPFGDAEAAQSAATALQFNVRSNVLLSDTTNGGQTNKTGINYSLETFGRAPGFFDEVCYTGNDTAGATQAHNLGVAPEMMIVKRRSQADGWFVYHSALGATKYIPLNDYQPATTTSAIWNNTAPTSSVFTLGWDSAVNGSGSTYVAYLFATVAGVSKVGSYTGTGTTQQINCGFTGGARFVLIKRTNGSGDSADGWYVWDSARGIVSGNDPYLLLNSTAAEVTSTDYIDTYSAGFEISSTAPAAINASGGTFIFLAIA